MNKTMFTLIIAFLLFRAWLQRDNTYISVVFVREGLAEINFFFFAVQKACLSSQVAVLTKSNLVVIVSHSSLKLRIKFHGFFTFSNLCVGVYQELTR